MTAAVLKRLKPRDKRYYASLDERDRLAEEAQKAKLAKTVTDLGRQFVEDYSKREKRAQTYGLYGFDKEKRAALEDQRILEKEIIPVIGKLPIEQVQRRLDSHGPAISRKSWRAREQAR